MVSINTARQNFNNVLRASCKKNDVQIWLDLINVKEMLICQAFEFLALRWNIKCRNGVVLFSRLLPSWRSRQLLHLPEVACLQLLYLLEQLRKKKKYINFMQ